MESKKYLISLSLFAIIIMILSLCVNPCSAAENKAKLEIDGEPTYNLLRKVTKGGEAIGYTYEIIFTLKNTGRIMSEETIVNLTDEEGFALVRTIHLDSGESEEIILTWSTLSERDQMLTVNYFPKNFDTVWNEYNSGSKTFKIIIGDEDSLAAASTPGFELIIFLASILICSILLKKKK